MIRVVLLLMLATSSAVASDAVFLGQSDETTIVGPGTDACASGVLVHNHDGSFENGYTWQYGGVMRPYYGAFGEGYSLGTGTVACGAFWLTTLVGSWPAASDCYVWQGGVPSQPGTVLGVVTDVVFYSIPCWPMVGQCDVDMNIAVTGPFTIGIWGNWPGAVAEYFVAADENGPDGYPWTRIAPGIGYPSGWQPVPHVWTNAKSMGCGVYFEQSTPAGGETWGAVKALYH